MHGKDTYTVYSRDLAVSHACNVCDVYTDSICVMLCELAMIYRLQSVHLIFAFTCVFLRFNDWQLAALMPGMVRNIAMTLRPWCIYQYRIES